MTFTRNDAYLLMCEFVQNQNLRYHMLAVEAAMAFYAAELAPQEAETWKIAGLLHDFDWEIHPTKEEHPLLGAEILRERQVPETIIRAILAHGDETGVERISLMEKALYACDEITGLITASALVRPSKSLMDLTASSVKKKWNNFNFAAGANRAEMEKGAQELGIELWQHTTNVITAMRSIAAEIGLAGIA